jgi:hypothetical protein
LPSPEYVAVIGYMPVARLADVVQPMAGRIIAQSVEPPEVKVTVPTALPTRPLSARVELFPNETLAGVALAVNDVLAAVTTSAVVAVEPA